MACLNINSLLEHIDEPRVFLESHKEIDIRAINETKLDPTTHDNEVYLPSFQISRKDRKGGGGGGWGGVGWDVVIYLCTNISFKNRPDLSPEALEYLTNKNLYFPAKAGKKENKNKVVLFLFIFDMYI